MVYSAGLPILFHRIAHFFPESWLIFHTVGEIGPVVAFIKKKAGGKKKQRTEEIEGRVTKKDSPEMSQTKIRMSVALSKFNEVVLN